MKDPNVQKETNPFMMSIEELDAEITRLGLNDLLDTLAEGADDVQTLAGYKRGFAPWIISFITSHNNSLVERLEGMKDELLANAEGKMDDETKAMKLRAIVRNATLTESQELIKNSLT